MQELDIQQLLSSLSSSLTTLLEFQLESHISEQSFLIKKKKPSRVCDAVCDRLANRISVNQGTLVIVKRETVVYVVRRRSILGWFEVPVNESLWFHAMEIGHALGTLKTPAHGMGGSVIGEGFSTMQHCEQKNTVTKNNTDNRQKQKKTWVLEAYDAAP